LPIKWLSIGAALRHDGAMSRIADIKVTAADGSETDLVDCKGKVLLIVNTASECGFTPQYEGLQELWLRYRDRGFAVLAFPSNQFGGQEPGSNEAIADFCSRTFGVTFPIFAKVDVNGARAAPLFEHLKAEAPGVLGSEAIKWNFTKFLVDRDGKVVRRYAPTTKPEAITADIEALL
jgi:glutathione peroxidase